MKHCSPFTQNAYKAFIDTNTVPELLFALSEVLNEIFTRGSSALEITLLDTNTTITSKLDNALTEMAPLNGGELFVGTLFSTASDIDTEVIHTIESLLIRKDETIHHTHKTVVETTERILGITYHDIRNTLGSISGIAQLMEMDAGENKELIDSIHDIVSIIDKYDQDSISSMKLLRGQPLTYNKVPFSLTELCDNQLKRSSRVYQLSSIEVTADVESSINCIGDEECVREIFQELLTNAATALSSKGGNIAVSVSKIAENAKISVSHNGSPIKSDVQEYIFTPFFTTKEKGRGMGLTRMKRYLSDWSGSIEFSSNSNQPVCFVATFPVTLP